MQESDFGRSDHGFQSTGGRTAGTAGTLVYVVFTLDGVVVHIDGIRHAWITSFHCIALGDGVHVGLVQLLRLGFVALVMFDLFVMGC